jgi:hypothetical protein
VAAAQGKGVARCDRGIRVSFRVSDLVILFALLFGSLSLPAFAQAGRGEKRPGREVAVPKTEVKDSFFAYVLGIIRTGIDIDINNEQMRAILTEFKTSLDLPFDLIARVTQTTNNTSGVRSIGLDFLRDVNIPIPFSLLFYHPGSIVASRDLLFTVNRTVAEDPALPGALSPVFDLSLSSGTVFVDIDDWLETLLAAYLEDTWIHHIVFFRWQGDWIGMLEGVGQKTGRELRAYFNFTRNTIVFPVSQELDAMGKGFVPVAAAAAR